MNTFPKGETALKVKPTDSIMSEGFRNQDRSRKTAR